MLKGYQIERIVLFQDPNPSLLRLSQSTLPIKAFHSEAPSFCAHLATAHPSLIISGRLVSFSVVGFEIGSSFDWVILFCSFFPGKIGMLLVENKFLILFHDGWVGESVLGFSKLFGGLLSFAWVAEKNEEMKGRLRAL